MGFNGGTFAPPVLPIGTVPTNDFTPPKTNLVICPKTSLVLFIFIPNFIYRFRKFQFCFIEVSTLYKSV